MENTNNAVASNNPWEDRKSIGFFKALFETIKRVLFKPGEFFSLLVVKDSIKSPYLFYYIVAYTSGILSVIVSMAIKPVPNPAFTLIFSVIFMAVITSFAVFIGAGVLHLGVMMFGGKGGYKGTLNVLAYASSTQIFSIIPFIGGLVSGIWSIVVGVKGFKRVHNMSTVRAVFAYLSILVILTVIGLMIALAIPNLVRARLDANFAAAKASVKTISTAIETYAVANNGKYPDSEYELVYKNPAYLSQSYNEKEIAGYRYFLDLTTNTYKIVAEPVSCNVTGNKVIVLEKGGELQEKDCK